MLGHFAACTAARALTPSGASALRLSSEDGAWISVNRRIVLREAALPQGRGGPKAVHNKGCVAVQQLITVKVAVALGLCGTSVGYIMLSVVGTKAVHALVCPGGVELAILLPKLHAHATHSL